MKICLLSNLGPVSAEGQRKMAGQLAAILSKKHKLMQANAKKAVLSRKFWKELKSFQPDVFQIILRPSLWTLLLGRILKLRFKQAKVILTALQPPQNLLIFKMGAIFFKSDLVLVQSAAEKELFSQCGWKTEFLFSGVNPEKFKPVSEEEKQKLRRKYKLSPDKFIVLHVGHINKGRNLSPLIKLMGQGAVQAVMVNSPVFKPDRQLLRQLIKSGCVLINEFMDDIQELYQLADAYMFATKDLSKSIAMPLSVLEAMACNLIVITTKFGALKDLFKENDGLFFADGQEELINIFQKIKGKRIAVNTRQKVLSYTWEKAAESLEKIYEKA